MTDVELEKKAEESYAKQLKDSSYYETGEEGAYICGYIARAKEMQEEMQEEIRQLKQQLDWANERETEWSNRIEELKTDLEYAKAIIKDLLNNSHEYARQNAEDFIKGEKN